MKKIYIIAVVVIFIISIIAYKQWQKESFGLKNPKLETKQTLESFLDSIKIDADYVIIPKNFKSYSIIKSDFDIPTIYVFNKDKVLIESNITNDNGLCLADISKMICNNFKNQNANFKNSKSASLFDLLISNTEEIKGKQLNLDGVEHIVVYSWGKFLKASYSEEAISFIKCKSKTTAIIFLNLDFVDSWYGQRELPVYVNE
jgi:hypothetical protein